MRTAYEPASPKELAAMRDQVRAATDRPGVYRMVSSDGEILYVGKSKQVRTRLLSYFRCAYPAEKGARILRQARSIEWDYCPSEFAALLRELRLIKRLRPRFNVAMKRDAHHYAFIKITGGPAPKLMVVRGAGGIDDGAMYYGPFHGARRVEESLRELTDALLLRDCALTVPMHFNDQVDLFDWSAPLPTLAHRRDGVYPRPSQTFAPARTPGCIRYEVHKCLGPCIGACSAGQYAQQVRLARAFLDGANDGPMTALRQQMHIASAEWQFERAATLRDKLERLELLQDQFRHLRFAVETLTFLYTVPGYEGDDRVYLVRRGVVQTEEFAPKSEEDRHKLRALVYTVFGDSGAECAPPVAAVPAHEVDELLLLSSWFRRYPKELERTASVAGVLHERQTYPT